MPLSVVQLPNNLLGQMHLFHYAPDTEDLDWRDLEK